MDLDRIFTLVVIMIIWVASNAIRKITRPEQKEPPPAAQKPGLFQILQQNLAALEESSQGEASISLDEYFQPQTDESETLIEMREDAMPQTAKIASPSAPPAQEAKPQAAIMQNKSAITTRRRLQNAIVWAEILAPPVALRNQ